MAGSGILKHSYDLSDEILCDTGVEPEVEPVFGTGLVGHGRSVAKRSG
jgi:hypothetical protein